MRWEEHSSVRGRLEFKDVFLLLSTALKSMYMWRDLKSFMENSHCENTVPGTPKHYLAVRQASFNFTSMDFLKAPCSWKGYPCMILGFSKLMTAGSDFTPRRHVPHAV